MKVFCIFNSSSHFLQAFVDSWCETNSFAKFSICDIVRVKSDLVAKQGVATFGLNCDGFFSLLETVGKFAQEPSPKFFGEHVPKVLPEKCVEIKEKVETFIAEVCDEKVKDESDLSPTCCSNSFYQEYKYNDDFVFWLDEKAFVGKSVLGKTNNVDYEILFKDPISFFAKWVENSNFSNDGFNITEGLEKLNIFLNAKFPKNSIGVYSNDSAMVGNNTFINNQPSYPFLGGSDNQHVALSSNKSMGLINHLQRVCGNSKACVTRGSASPIGFLLACMGHRLVSESEFFILFLNLNKAISDCDLVILFDDDINLLNVDSGFLPLIKNSIYHEAKPLLLISEKLDLSHLELNDFLVSSSYTYDGTGEDVKKLAKNLANTWKF